MKRLWYRISAAATIDTAFQAGRPTHLDGWEVWNAGESVGRITYDEALAELGLVDGPGV